MSYELINKDLNLWSFSAANMKIEDVGHLINKGLIENKSEINSLIVLYISEEDKIIINQENNNNFTELALIYFSLSDERQTECREELLDLKFKTETSRMIIGKFVNVLDYCIFSRKMKKLENLLGK